MNESGLLFFKEPVDFKRRLGHTLLKPSAIFFFAFLTVGGFVLPITWAVVLFFGGLYVYMNVKGMIHYLSEVRLIDETVHFSFYNYKMEKGVLQVPVADLMAEHYGTTRGPSSYVGDHIRIRDKGETILKQYQTIGWSAEDFYKMERLFKELRRRG